MIFNSLTMMWLGTSLPSKDRAGPGFCIFHEHFTPASCSPVLLRAGRFSLSLTCSRAAFLIPSYPHIAYIFMLFYFSKIPPNKEEKGGFPRLQKFPVPFSRMWPTKSCLNYVPLLTSMCGIKNYTNVNHKIIWVSFHKNLATITGKKQRSFWRKPLSLEFSIISLLLTSLQVSAWGLKQILLHVSYGSPWLHLILGDSLRLWFMKYDSTVKRLLQWDLYDSHAFM